MEFEIVWTQSASRNLAEVLTYLETEWSFKIAQGFSQELQNRIELIRIYPEMGIQSSSNKLIRRILITRHNVLYYLVENNKIILLNIIDTRSSLYGD